MSEYEKLDEALDEISEGYDKINNALSLVAYEIDEIETGLDRIEAGHDVILCLSEWSTEDQIKNLAVINAACEAMRRKIDLLADDPKALNVLRDMGLELDQIGVAYDAIYDDLLTSDNPPFTLDEKFTPRADPDPAWTEEVGGEAVEDADIEEHEEEPGDTPATQIRLFLQDFKMSDILQALMDMTDGYDTRLYQDLYNDAKWHRKPFIQYEEETKHNSYVVEIE